MNDFNDTLQTISDPSEMVDLLVEECRRHFAQAEGSLFTTTPLANI